MKLRLKIRISILMLLCFTAGSMVSIAQDSSAGEPAVQVRYFVNNNSMQYLLIKSGVKFPKKFVPLPKQVVKIFLDSNSVENLITKTYTDENGVAKVFITPAMKAKWNSTTKHTFIAVLEASSAEDERTTSLEITKAKISIDTSRNEEGIRIVSVSVMSFSNNEWIPAADVEMKVGIRRHGSLLSGGDEETYTTDSTGIAQVEFKKDSLPGDEKGNIMLVGQVEDNELYGNLLIEKEVQWGIPAMTEKNFFEQRTLWSIQSRTPLWLLLMAYSIILAVWGTIIFLIVQIVRIKKMGMGTKSATP